MGGTPIMFFKGSGQRYRSVLHRRDRVQVELDGGGYNDVGGSGGRVPHDLAHFIVEDCLGLDFGSTAPGIGHTAVIAGLPTITVEALTRAGRELRDAGARWAALAPGEHLEVVWRRS